jgi:hypothetical protein
MGKKGGAPSSEDESGIPPAIEKIHNTIDFSLTKKSEIDHMRTRLIQELKTPFIERVSTAPSYDHIKEVKIENFDERVMTLPDREVFDLYSEYLKIRTIKSEEKKELVRNSILDRLASRILSNGHFLRRIFKDK